VVKKNVTNASGVTQRAYTDKIRGGGRRRGSAEEKGEEKRTESECLCEQNITWEGGCMNSRRSDKQIEAPEWDEGSKESAIWGKTNVKIELGESVVCDPGGMWGVGVRKRGREGGKRGPGWTGEVETGSAHRTRKRVGTLKSRLSINGERCAAACYRRVWTHS